MIYDLGLNQPGFIELTVQIEIPLCLLFPLLAIFAAAAGFFVHRKQLLFVLPV